MKTTRQFLAPLLVVFCLCVAVQASEIKWPKNYVVREGSESPNKRFAVLIPTVEEGLKDDEKVNNYVVDLKAHHVIEKINSTHYFQGRNHSGMEIVWAPDSTWCVCVFEARWGFDSVSVLEMEGKLLKQHEIGDHIQKSLDRVIAKESHEPKTSGDAQAHFRLSPDRKLRVRATGSTNPKRFEGQKTYCALFQGTFVLNSGTWIVEDTRSLNVEHFDDLDMAYASDGLESTTFSDDEATFKARDEQMNSVYRVVRLLLTPDRFVVVKKNQIAWLKERDKRSSVVDRTTMTMARTKVLQELLW